MIKHLKTIGFTNRLALYIIGILSAGVCMSFALSVYSIYSSYTGALYCWTAIWTPIGTVLSAVLVNVVTKSKEENTGATEKSGEGVKYAMAMAATKSASTVTSV